MSETEKKAVAEHGEVGSDATAEAKSKEVVIAVANPTPEEMAALRVAIKESFDFNVNVKEMTFNFKKSIDKETGITTIRNPVDLAIPYPSVEGIIAILEKGGKGLELLVETIELAITQQARNLLYEDTALKADTFPVDKCSWEFLANIPKAQRRGGGIPKDVWDAFAADYIEVMPEATGKDADQVGRMAKILTNKLVQIRTNEPVLQLVVEQLAVYAGASANVEEYQECLDFLINKADTFLNVKPEDLLANL